VNTSEPLNVCLSTNTVNLVSFPRYLFPLV